ncbi:hypothetical protein [Kribbella sp. NPDC049227]|uniref:hypothetical protein n=1 Tax=Kribbella sp. NPDC049227 TaxID=3364113 RepID=UPI00372452BB
MPTPAEVVPAILAAAQLTVSESEMTMFVRDYPLMRQAADALYQPEFDPDEPAIRFDPLDFYPAGKDA